MLAGLLLVRVTQNKDSLCIKWVSCVINLSSMTDETLLVRHRMLSEYIAASPGSSVSEAVQLLAGPPLVRMVHTKEGAQVACSVIAYGTAKDRKKAIKGIAGLPDTVLKMAQDEWGSVVLMCILDTVDDTALLKKQILPDILVSDAVVVTCDNACQVRMQVYTLFTCGKFF